MLVTKGEWDALVKNPPREEKKVSKGDKLIEMQLKILATLSMADMRRLAATCNMLPLHEKDRNGFESRVLAFMAGSFIENGDRQSLVTLLSTRFQEYIGPEMTLTYYLLRCPTKALKDPILVLGEAYQRCSEPDVRRQIAQVVRQGFDGCGVTAKDDAEFVEKAMKWYENNKSHLTPRMHFTGRYPNSFFEDDRKPEN
jgi:hypothetical protein